MKKTIALVAAFAVLALSACGEIPDRGIVTAHDYNGPWMQMVCYSYDKHMRCTYQQPVYHDAEWNILVDPNTGDEGGEAWISYSQDVFETFPIGSVWTNPNPRAEG